GSQHEAAAQPVPEDRIIDQPREGGAAVGGGIDQDDGQRQQEEDREQEGARQGEAEEDAPGWATGHGRSCRFGVMADGAVPRRSRDRASPSSAIWGLSGRGRPWPSRRRFPPSS